MRRFLVLLKKELAELITLQMFLPFIIVIVMFVSIGQVIGDVGAKNAGAFPIAVADRDSGAYSAVVVKALEQSGFKPVKVDLAEGDGANAKAMDEASSDLLLIVPKGFSSGLGAGKPQKLETVTRIRHFSFVGNGQVNALSGALGIVNSAVAAQIASSAAPNVPTQMLQAPIATTEYVMIDGRSAQTSAVQVMSFVSQQTTFIPIVLFVAVIFASQMIGTAIATEKENKTLETLLSYPVTRASIVVSKMVAAGLVALLAGGAYMFGISRYMSGIETGLGGGAGERAAAASEAAMQQLGLTFGAMDYALMGLTLFAGILVALSIAIILGAFAENVKSVQALLTPLMVLMLLPYFLTMFLDLNSLSEAARLGVMAIPFTYLFTAGPNLFLGNYATVWFGIVYQFIWFAVFVTIAARVFSSDRILTMKLSLGRGKKQPA